MQLPETALSRKFIENNSEYKLIKEQLINERNWCREPQSADDANKTGYWHLEHNGYSEWLKDAENNDFIRMVGVLHLTIETFSSLTEDIDDED